MQPLREFEGEDDEQELIPNWLHPLDPFRGLLIVPPPPLNFAQLQLLVVLQQPEEIEVPPRLPSENNTP